MGYGIRELWSQGLEFGFTVGLGSRIGVRGPGALARLCPGRTPSCESTVHGGRIGILRVMDLESYVLGVMGLGCCAWG